MSRSGPLPAPAGHRALSALQAELYSGDLEFRWRAVMEIAERVTALSAHDLEAARDFMRRLMWSLNDESGAIGWGAAETMAEIMAREERLAAEFAGVLVSFIMPEGNYLEYEPLLAGAVWGIGRLAQTAPGRVLNAAPYLMRLLDAKDASVRGMAAWALGKLGAEEARDKLATLQSDDNVIALFEAPKLRARAVGELAQAALAELGG